MRSSRYRGSLTAGELSETLRRSCSEAQAMFLTAREEAVRAYGETDEAARNGLASEKIV